MEPLTFHHSERKGQVIPFFVLNADAREDRLREMVQECVDAGFDGIIIHPRPGLRIPYMSKAWLDAVECCIKEAQRLGIKSWLYDEFPWPSGAAGGRVIRRNAEFAERHLKITRYPLQGGQKVTQMLGTHTLQEVFLVPRSLNGKLDLSQAQIVSDRVGTYHTTWISSPWDSRYYYPSEYVERYTCPRAMDYFPQQVFTSDLPEGEWTLIVFEVVTGGDFLEPFGHYVDLSNREATQAFLEETHEVYAARFGKWFGTQIPGIFTDEPKYRNVLPWSRSISDHWGDYQKDRKALLALLPESRDGERVESYRRTTQALFSQNWVQPIAQWCRNQHLDLIGHISPEEDWMMESRFCGSILQHLRHFATPGCDLIIPAAGDHAHPVLNFTPLLAVSAAAQSGAGQALCETFGASDYTLDLQTLKRVADWLMVSGINIIVPHGCFYSLDGPRRWDAPPTFLPPSTMHGFLAHWSAHIRATATRLGPERPVDVALVRPMRYLLGLSENPEDAKNAQRIFDEAIKVAQFLLDRGIAFHFVDDTDLLEAEYADGNLIVGKAKYTHLILPEVVATDPAQKELEQAKAAGISITAFSKVRTLKGPLECPEGDVRVAKDASGHWFCVNLSSQPRYFLIEGVPYSLERYESCWVHPSGEEVDEAPAVSFQHLLENKWQITPKGENSFRLTQWNCNGTPHRIAGAYACLVPQQKGAVTVYGRIPENSVLDTPQELIYETTFQWKGETSDISLRLEKGAAEGTYQVFFNGTRLSDWQPHEDFWGGVVHPLKHLLRSGENRIRIAFQAHDAREGLWLEPLLAGDFIVDKNNALSASEKEIQGRDWSTLGYPHYSGCMDFTQIFAWEKPQVGQEVYLTFSDPPSHMVEVILNDIPMGKLMWSPWKISLSGALREGRNKLTLRVTNTLFNFLHGKPRTSGLPDRIAIQILTAAPQHTAAPSHSLTQPALKK